MLKNPKAEYNRKPSSLEETFKNMGIDYSEMQYISESMKVEKIEPLEELKPEEYEEDLDGYEDDLFLMNHIVYDFSGKERQSPIKELSVDFPLDRLYELQDKGLVKIEKGLVYPTEAGLSMVKKKDESDFIEWLEEAMSPNEAIEILGLSAQDAMDPAAIKKAYREASRKHHPDLGGDAEKMKEVNAAYETLQGGVGTPGAGSAVVWDNIRKELRSLAIAVKDYLKREFDVDAFLDYLKKFDPAIEVVSQDYFPNDEVMKDEKFRPSSVGLNVKFSTPDGKRALKLQLYVLLSDMLGKSALGDKELTVPMRVMTFVYVDGKDQKIKQSNYTFTSKKAVIIDPKEVFPEARMKKIFSGEARKDSKFARRDMQAALQNELKAVLQGKEPYAYIPIGEDEEGNPLEFSIYRTVFMRQPAWSTMGVWRKKGISRRMIQGSVLSLTFSESYDTIEKLKDIQAKAMAAPSSASDKVAVVNRELTELKKMTNL